MSKNLSQGSIVQDLSEEGYEMEPEQVQICENILESLLRRPISLLFYQTPKDVETLLSSNPTTLQYVQKRLKTNSYSSAYDFVQDIRSVLYIGLTSKDQFRKSGALLLSNELEALIIKLLPGLEEIPRKLNQIHLKISEHIDSFPKDNEIFKDLNLETQPGCELFSNPEYQPEKATSFTLKRDLSMIKSPSILTYVFALIYRHQPEVINIGDNVSINFSLMTQETIVAASNYLHTLIKHALYSDAKTLMNITDDDNNLVFPNSFVRIPQEN